MWRWLVPNRFYLGLHLGLYLRLQLGLHLGLLLNVSTVVDSELPKPGLYRIVVLGLGLCLGLGLRGALNDRRLRHGRQISHAAHLLHQLLDRIYRAAGHVGIGCGHVPWFWMALRCLRATGSSSLFIDSHLLALLLIHDASSMQFNGCELKGNKENHVKIFEFASSKSYYPIHLQ
jgi:hypothetical protein